MLRLRHRRTPRTRDDRKLAARGDFIHHRRRDEGRAVRPASVLDSRNCHVLWQKELRPNETGAKLLIEDST
jgi:hypothetical protein